MAASAALFALVMWSFAQLLFGAFLGPAGRTVFALLGAIVFSGYIVFDTEQLIARFDLDDYIMASVALYLVCDAPIYPCQIRTACAPLITPYCRAFACVITAAIACRGTPALYAILAVLDASLQWKALCTFCMALVWSVAIEC